MYFTDGELDTLQAAHRQVPVDPTSSQVLIPNFGGWSYTCIRHYVHCMIVDGWWQDDETGEVVKNTPGGVYNSIRSTIFIFHRNETVLSDKVKYFRTVAHELGHTFNLHHEDADKGVTLMAQTKTLEPSQWTFEFSATSAGHLTSHPAECVWPGPLSVLYIAPDHDPQYSTHTDWDYDRTCPVGGGQAQPTPAGPSSGGAGFWDGAADSTGREESAARAGLVLAVHTDKTRYAIGEPVHATVSLRNRGSEAVSVAASLAHRFGDLEVWLARSDGAKLGVTPLVHLESTAEPISLAPGDALYAVVPVFFGVRGWTITEPGSYRVFVALREPASGARLVADQGAEISVVDDRAGALLVSGDEASIEAGTFLLWRGGDHLAAGIDLLQRVIDVDPDSDVANHARLVLGASLSSRFRNYLAGEVRPPKPDLALPLLDAVDEARLSRYHRIQLQLARARLSLWSAHEDVSNGRVDAARPHLESSRRDLARAVRLAGERPELDAYRDRIGLTRNEIERVASMLP